MALETISSEKFDPSDFLSEEVSTGTSIMGVTYNDGVIIGADSRTTTGAYIANRVSDKLTKITDNIYCCRSGSAADTQALADIVSYRLNLFRMENNEEPTVYAAAHLFQNLCYNYRSQLTAAIIVAGWDKRKGGQVYSIPLGGMLSSEKWAIGGSGSGYIYGFCDEHFKEKMSEDECVNFVKEGLTHAIMRDGSSGGCIRVAVINQDGIQRKLYLNNELKSIY